MKTTIKTLARAAVLGAALPLAAALAATATPAHAQGSDPEHRVQIDFNRWHDHADLTAAFQRLADAYPKFLTLSSIGKSVGGRDLILMTINNPDTGDELSKAGMYIEANVHGNEIQGGEVALYTVWYLMENYQRNENIRRMVDERVFYILPSVNPDGRDYFLHGTGSGARTGHFPVDDDNDGLVDEDGPNDLNGNGVIEQIRKYVPGEGDYRISHEDPRILEPVPPGQKGDWVLLGYEGIDDDGDGRVNEDPPGSYDPNRNWAADWQPNYIQRGAMDYPFQLPETRAVNDFLMARPNIAGVQSYHNSGGMILRGPGAEWQGGYPQEDVAVYDELAEDGERMLPYYRYLVIWSGLYTVHGGFIDWTNDGLGILSFSNELWNGRQYFNSPELQQQQEDPDSPIGGRSKARLWFDDHLEFGEHFHEWTPYDHPDYGAVELGGWGKLTGRIPPRFMNEELAHRNMAFTLYQADQMPLMAMDEPIVEKLGDDVYRVRVDLVNDRITPTIIERAAMTGIVRPDLLSVDGADVVTAGWVASKHRPGPTDRIDQHDLQRIMIRNGHPGRTTRTVEYVLKGSGRVTFTYDSLKGGTVSRTVTLR
ncbi:MAG: M14 family metallopeptidase [Gemmatimonadota bacterium]